MSLLLLFGGSSIVTEATTNAPLYAALDLRGEVVAVLGQDQALAILESYGRTIVEVPK